MAFPADLRNRVRSRAADRCEYCQLHQDDDSFFRFHLEHVIARQHGGESVESNLALACHHCNLHEGPNLTGIDPDTGAVVSLYNPRTQRWSDHFAVVGRTIHGLTPAGRTTIRVLAMNASARQELRRPPT